MERRYTTRVKHRIPAVLFYDNEEFQVLVIDISNGGLAFSSDELHASLKEGSVVQILFTDELSWNSREYTLIIRCEVRHWHVVNHSTIYGVSVINDDAFGQYVDDLKAGRLISALHSIYSSKQ